MGLFESKPLFSEELQDTLKIPIKIPIPTEIQLIESIYCKPCDKQFNKNILHCEICHDNALYDNNVHNCKKCKTCHNKRFSNYCDICNKCNPIKTDYNQYGYMDTNINNVHCHKCKTCVSKDYIHCDLCNTCHDENKKLCNKCKKCHYTSDYINHIYCEKCETCIKYYDYKSHTKIICIKILKIDIKYNID
jgi:hypothetical protein